MRFISVREFKSKSGKAWKSLGEAGDVVLTNNGRPVAMLSSVSEGGVEDSLAALRKARAILAVQRIQARSVTLGLDKMSLRDIDKEIGEVRRERGR